jgi:hypothetical protein
MTWPPMGPMTKSIVVTLEPQPARLRLLTHSGSQSLLQAQLTPMSPWAAVPALLQGLSDYQAKPHCIVLCADESGTCMLSDAFSVLGQQGRSHWPVELAVVPRSRHRVIDCNRDFDDLRELHIEGGRP